MSIRVLKKVALVADARNWALGNIAKYIVQNLSDKYQFEVLYTEDYANIADLYLRLFVDKPYDLVHFLFRRNLFILKLLNPYFLEPTDNLEWRKYTEGFANTVITTSVYDHLFLGDTDIAKHAFYYNYVLSGYTVSSEKLYQIYAQIPEYPRPEMIIEDGVDTDLFSPGDLEHSPSQDNFVVGWVGNSRWGMEDGQDHKGLHSIIIPALDILKHEGLSIIEKFADRNQGFIPQQQMPDYYHSVDVLLCASDIEGTPNPILEAMACGVPVISTDVGLVSQVFGPLQRNFILKERTPQCLAAKLKELMGDADLQKVIARENILQMHNWTRNHEAVKWGRFFDKYLKSNQAEDWEKSQNLKVVKLGLMELQQKLTPYLSDLRSKVQNRKVFIWGAGQGGFKTSAYVKKQGIMIDGFLDKNPEKTGTKIEQVPVYLPEFLQESSTREMLPFVFIGSSHIHSITKQLLHMGFKEGHDFLSCDFLW